MIQLNPSITPGNQKWKGAAPIFNIRDELIRIDKGVVEIIKVFGNLIDKDTRITANNKVAEAKAWVRKYFSDASLENKFRDVDIKGIKDNRLISRPIQAPNHEFADTVIKVPLIKVIRNKNLVGLLNIRKKKGKTSISGVWTQ